MSSKLFWLPFLKMILTEKVLDLKLNYSEGEWWTYGFYPVLLSAGADLINRQDYQSASGTLDSEAAIKAMEHVQSWIKQGYVDPNTNDDAFINGEVGLSWVGHWGLSSLR